MHGSIQQCINLRTDCHNNTVWSDAWILPAVYKGLAVISRCRPDSMKAMHLSSPAPHHYGLLNRVVNGVLYADKVDPGSRRSNSIHTATLTQNVVTSQCGRIERGRPNVQLVQQSEDLSLGVGTPVTAMRLSGKKPTCRFAVLQHLDGLDGFIPPRS